MNIKKMIMKNKNTEWFLKYSLIIVIIFVVCTTTATSSTIVDWNITTHDTDSNTNTNITDNLITEIEKSAIIIVAASDSTIFDKEQADFIADGIDDQVTIQAAIDALPACGGKILLMEGTFNISATVYLRSNMIIEGEGSNFYFPFKEWNYYSFR